MERSTNMRPQFLTGLIRLSSVDSILPHSGTGKALLPVDLTTDHKLRTAWRGEIRVLGESAWKRGETRPVELEIEAKPFRDYVASWRPKVYVCRDGELIGEFEFADVPRYSDSENLSAKNRSGKT